MKKLATAEAAEQPKRERERERERSVVWRDRDSEHRAWAIEDELITFLTTLTTLSMLFNVYCTCFYDCWVCLLFGGSWWGLFFSLQD